MTVIALAGLKGSPGVTTLATALAATWPRHDDSPVLLIEADPAGGVLGPRHHVSAEPSLASYMADARRGFDPAIAAANSQEVVPGVRALIGPVDPAVSERSLSWGATALADGLIARPHLPVVVDLGRLDAVSPAAPLAQAAHETLMVIRPSLEQAAIGVHRAMALTELGCRLSLVVVGTGPDDPGDVAHAMGLGLAGVIPEVDNAADVLRDAYAGKRRARRTLLWQSITALSEGVAQRAAAAVAGIPMPQAADPFEQHQAQAAAEPGEMAAPHSLGEWATGSTAPPPPPAPLTMQQPISTPAPTEGYVAEGYVAEGYVAEGYVAEGYVAEGYVAEGYSTTIPEPPPAPPAPVSVAQDALLGQPHAEGGQA